MPLAREDAAHLLRRAGFGGSAAEIQALTLLDPATAVTQVLTPPSGGLPAGPPSVGTSTNGYQVWLDMVHWWIDRMRTSTAPAAEKLALFWHDHFATSMNKVNDPVDIFHQNQIFRANGLGSFRALTHAVAIDPAMILWLDNDPNTAGAPNENFARELMELFTLGVDQYTQDDVVASARAWTGHGVDSTGEVYQFHPENHDSGMKTFFGITQNWDGPQIVDEILQGAKAPIAARFIANKVWSWFAYPNPPSTVIDTVTAAFLASSDLNITALLTSIFNQPEFYSPAAKQGLLRTPTEFIVAALRATGIAAADANPEWWMDGMGQTLFYPPNVAGWHQNSYWISSAAVWARAGFARNLTWKAVTAGILANVSTLAVSDAVQLAFDTFGIVTPSAATRTDLENWLTAERAAKSGAEQANLITLTMLTPEFQLA